MWTTIKKWVIQKMGGWFLQPGWFKSGWFQNSLEFDEWTITDREEEE